MTDLMETLYLYAQEHLVHSYASLEPEYNVTVSHFHKQAAAFRAALDDAQKQRYDDLLQEEALLSFFEERALFRAGLHVAFELFR